MSGLVTRIWTMKFVDRARGRKYYRAGMTYSGQGRMSRRTFGTATEAHVYGMRLKVRVRRMGGV